MLASTATFDSLFAGLTTTLVALSVTPPLKDWLLLTLSGVSVAAAYQLKSAYSVPLPDNCKAKPAGV
jgi:hypothetical protein